MNLNQLKFLTDENIDLEILYFLRNEGFDVFDIKEEKLFSLSDRNTLNIEPYKLKKNKISFSI
jgi:hypothetical protein